MNEKQSITVDAIRVNCNTGGPRKTFCTMKVHRNMVENSHDLPALWITEGGVTGYESFYLDDRYVDWDRLCDLGWFACAGTKGRWDKLLIPAESMRQVRAWLETALAG